MGQIIRHNLNAVGANNNLNANVLGTKKATEKLASGYQINRAGDNASGLAVSEKMRAQIGGLTQATKNTQDAISLIQTAEGGLNETHSILQRMRDLAVQSANGTYQNETDREAIQLEVDALKSEIDRIAASTEYNGIKLLDGSLDGKNVSGEYGARYGAYLTADPNAGAEEGKDLIGINTSLEGSTIISSVADVKVNLKEGATVGGENAEWDTAGKELTFNLVKGKSYTQSQIDDMIKKATDNKGSAQTANPPEVSFKLKNGSFSFVGDESFETITGVRASSGANLTPFLSNGTAGGGAAGGTADKYADTIKITSNNYGNDARRLTITTDSEAGKETVERTKVAGENLGIKDGEFTIHLSTGKEYSASDIEKILAKEGLDYKVELSDVNDPDGDTKFYANVKDASVKVFDASADPVKAARVAAKTEYESNLNANETKLKDTVDAINSFTNAGTDLDSRRLKYLIIT